MIKSNCILLVIVTLVVISMVSYQVEAYPIYKFGLYRGDSNSVDACGVTGDRGACFIWDLELYPDCYQFSATESYSGALFDSTSLSYDLHPTCTDCSCSTGAGRKGTDLGECTFFPYGGVYWLKLECILENENDACASDYIECTDCLTGCDDSAQGNEGGEDTTGGVDATDASADDVDDGGDETSGVYRNAGALILFYSFVATFFGWIILF